MKKLLIATLATIVLSLGVFASLAVADNNGNGQTDPGGTNTCQPGDHSQGGSCVHNGDGAGNCGQNQSGDTGNGNGTNNGNGGDHGYGNSTACGGSPDPGTSTGTNPADSNPADTTPADTTPADTTPADTNPADTTPADTNPADTTPADSNPADSNPADSNPADGNPNSDQTSQSASESGGSDAQTPATPDKPGTPPSVATLEPATIAGSVTITAPMTTTTAPVTTTQPGALPDRTPPQTKPAHGTGLPASKTLIGRKAHVLAARHTIVKSHAKLHPTSKSQTRSAVLAALFAKATTPRPAPFTK